MPNLYHSIKIARTITDRVLVSFSGGKDSVATLDVCAKNFPVCEAFFMYAIKGLSFQEHCVRYYEKRYGIKIHRIPHFMIAEWFRYGAFRIGDFNVPIVSVKEVYNYMREKTGIYWIAAGERIKDSIVRRAMIKESGTIDTKRGRIYPIAEWSKKDVVTYNRQNKLPLSPENRILGFSFRSLMPDDLIAIKKHYSKDFKKIVDWFPLVEANIKQAEFYAKKQIPKG